MAHSADSLRSGEWKGQTGRQFRNVINIGMGGSDLGPVMAYEALKHYSVRHMNFRFVSNVNSTDMVEAVGISGCGGNSVLSCRATTFTTLETITNARTAGQGLVQALAGDENAVAKHFVAVSTTSSEVTKFGIDTANIFEFWDWVGGRYSMSSVIERSTMIAIGPDQFHAMLSGLHQMDERFRSVPFERNMPVILGLLALLCNNFFGAHTIAVLPYEEYLKFPPIFSN